MVVELVPLMGGKKIQATSTKLYTSHPQKLDSVPLRGSCLNFKRVPQPRGVLGQVFLFHRAGV